MNKFKGILELNWINKDKSLYYELDEDGNPGKPIWVDKNDIRVSEPRILKLVEEYGDVFELKDPLDNAIIRGDNLLALRTLVEIFKERNEQDKVKCIYIDPPYNTGSAFEHYDDNLEHSQWLTMMKDRLVLLKNLLRSDGIIFIQIDDEEHAYLKIIMDEIFGRDNKIAVLIWDLGTGTTAGHFTRSHEYILAYAKDKDSLSNFKNPDKNEIIKHGALKKPSRVNPFSRITFPVGMEYDGKNAIFEGILGGSEKQKIVDGKMVFENGKLKYPVTLEAGWAMRNQILSWLEGKETFDSKGQHVIRFYFNKSGILWYEKEKTIVNPRTVLSDFGSTKTGTKEVEKLLPGKTFDFPKPEKLIGYLIKLTTKDGDIVLDSFAGSGTTGAVAHKMGRRWIIIEIGNHCLTHIIPRLKQIIGNNNTGFRYYELGNSLINDTKINWQLSYEEIARALFMNFDYNYKEKISDNIFIGKSGWNLAICIVGKELKIIKKEEVEELLSKITQSKNTKIAIFTNHGVAIKNDDLPDNISIKKIPESILKKYNL